MTEVDVSEVQEQKQETLNGLNFLRNACFSRGKTEIGTKITALYEAVEGIGIEDALYIRALQDELEDTDPNALPF